MNDDGVVTGKARVLDSESLSELREKLHQSACSQGDHTYIDPISKLPVFTKISHLERGSCCNSGCRHCPYPTPSLVEQITKLGHDE